MGRRIVKISPCLLQDMFTVGNLITDVETYNGLPEGAKFLRAWYDGSTPGDGEIVLLFEHDSWPDNTEGERYPVVDVVMGRAFNGVYQSERRP